MFIVASRIICYLLSCLTLIIFLALINNKHFWHAKYFPVKHVIVEGSLNFLPKEQIPQLLQPMLYSGYFGIDLLQIKKVLLKINWVETINVYREWPFKIVIKLTEKQPMLRFNNVGIIDSSGKLFYEKNLQHFSDLPVILGDINQLENLVLDYFTLSKYLEPQFKIIEFNDNVSVGKTAVLDQGLMLYLGSTNLEDKLRRFVFSYKQSLYKTISEVAYIDLRYINGIAIG